MNTLIHGDAPQAIRAHCMTGKTGATFSPCGEYRYALWRRFMSWATPQRMVAFIGLNPSTADETHDDATIRRCMGFAKRWGYDGILMLNLFALRATDPRVMRKHESPVGPWNDDVIRISTGKMGRTICCWGAGGGHRNRAATVLQLLQSQPLYHLGLTKAGHPRHPLYLPANTTVARLCQ